MYKYTNIQQLDESRQHTIKVELNYQKENWYQSPRGIYLHIQPMVVQKNGIWITESYQHGTGIKLLIKQLNRKSDKLLNSIGKQLYPELDNIARLFQENKSDEIQQLLTKLTA